ncbi:MAG: hypothetical protein AB7O88_12780 [Reyranellaceae bacterium]
MHFVYGQEAGMSCGLASVMMCVFKVNKLVPGKTAITVEEDIRKKYEAELGQGYNSEVRGTKPQHLATILTSFTSGTWRWHSLQPEAVTAKLIAKVGVTTGFGPVATVEPVILGVDWDLGGAHWIVIDTIRKVFDSSYATVNDPWDANVHVQEIKDTGPFTYQAGEGGFMMNAWDKSIAETRKKQYKNTSNGMVKKWGMICRD